MRHHVWVTQLRTLDLVVDATSSDEAERLVRNRLHAAAAEPWVESATVVKVSAAHVAKFQRETMQEPPPRQLWPVPIAAERLGVSRTILYALMKDGTLGAVQIGRRRFVADEQLQHYIARRTTFPEPPGDAT